MPLVVALHARGGDAPLAVRSARAVFGDNVDIVAPQAARPCNPFQSNHRGEPAYEGFSWYLGHDVARPEAASFGDALVQLDLLVGALGRRFVLTGDGQGAVLALTLALHAPPGLAGVHMCSAAPPEIDGWAPPRAKLNGIPFLVTGESDAGALAKLRALLEPTLAQVVKTNVRSFARWIESPDASSCGDRDA
ncbi:MAG: alpha/beta hydrolase [Candidatus Binatia bacterium]